MGQEIIFEETPLVRNHVYLSHRGLGASKYLTGDVTIVVVLVNDTESSWTGSSKKEIYACVNNALKDLMVQAKDYGAQLNLRSVYVDYTSTVSFNNLTMKKVIKRFLASYGTENVDQFQTTLEQRAGVDETPILFVTNKQLRSFAASATPECPEYDEFSTIFRGPTGEFLPHVLGHELLHQFGARDYYYPQKVVEAAKKWFPDSIMNSGKKVDPLTAYVVGWTDALAVSAARFLIDTAKCTEEYIREGKF